MKDLPTWFALIFALTGATAFFTFCYRRALIWFIRARVDARWASPAELMTLAGSLPFAFVCGLLSVNLSRWVGRAAVDLGVSLSLLTRWLEILDCYRYWLIAGIGAVFLAYVVPQTIATSKVYAVSIEVDLNQSEQ